jgi:hypothetical protein
VPRERQGNGISTMSEAIAFGKVLRERAEAVGMQGTRVSKEDDRQSSSAVFVAVTVVRLVSRIAFQSVPKVGMRAKIFTM